MKEHPQADILRAIADPEKIRYVVQQHGSNPYAATRLAIVRAAAEIGRNMK